MLVDIASQTLQRLGYKVTGSMSSLEALNLLKADPNKYDILITDFTMPKMTGDALVKQALEIRPGLPVILCTGYSENIDKQKAQALGIGRFLMKPVEEYELAEAVRGLLNEAYGRAALSEDA
jgi:CheY-like chemotaxis protein